MAYRVARHTREIGIRIAVGARQQTLVWMMVRETLLLVTFGAAFGTLASLAVNRYIAGQLFGVTPRDPVAIVVALSVLGIVTMLAGYGPHATRRATFRHLLTRCSIRVHCLLTLGCDRLTRNWDANRGVVGSSNFAASRAVGASSPSRGRFLMTRALTEAGGAGRRKWRRSVSKSVT